MIITENDVFQLSGKFIIQLNENQQDFDLSKITDDKWGFYKEKRISFVCGLTLCGFFYTHMSFNSSEEFVDYFNNYYKGQKTRFHRLLTNKELDFLNEKLKENNY